MPEQTDIFLDKVIGGRFHTVQNLGAGGMGTVYKAKDLQGAIEAEYVALKILHPELMRNPAILERTQREAVAMNKLSHQNIAKLYFAANARVPVEGAKQNIFIIAMEYIPCLDLEDNDELKRLSIGQRMQFVSDVADALQHMHDMGVVHRDVKPANILVDRNTLVPKLTDFGIMREEGAQTLTQEDTFMGSPHYAPPEQCDSKRVDRRSDIYALCSTLYHFAALEAPYDGLGAAEIVKNRLYPLKFKLDEFKAKMEASKRREFYRTQIANLDFDENYRPKNLLDIDAYIPAEVVEIVEIGMRVDPDRRFQQARDLKARIDKYLDDEDSKVKEHKGDYTSVVKLMRPKTMPKRRQTPVPQTANNKMMWVVGGAIGAAALLGVGSALVLSGNGKPNKPNNAVVLEDPRKNEFASLYKKVNELYSALEKSYSGQVHSQLNGNIDTCVNLLWSIDVPNEANIKTDLSDKKDKAVTFQHMSLYADAENQCQGFESKLKSAQQAPYDLARIAELDSMHKALENESRKIDSARVPDAKQLPAKLETYADAIDELRARDPSKKYAAAEKHLSKAKRQIEVAVQMVDKRELMPVYEAVNAAKELLSNVPDKSDAEYRQVEKQMLDLEQRAKEEEKYLAEFVLRFDRPEDADYFTGDAVIKDSKLQIDGEVQLAKPFEKGDFRFFAEGDLSVIAGAYELKFKGCELSVAKAGSEVASYIFDARKKNFVKLEKSGSVYVNGEKMLNLDNVSSQVRIKGKASLDDVAMFD
jgi:serine/threonine protein kinase